MEDFGAHGVTKASLARWLGFSKSWGKSVERRHCGWSPGVVGAESPKVLCYFSAMLAKCCKPEGEQTAQIPKILA